MGELSSLLLITLLTGLASCQNLAPEWTETLEGTLENLPEDTAVGSELGFLRASDPEGSPITYSTAPGSFVAVDAQSGRVTLASKLDRETTSELPVTFYATDNDGNKITIEYMVRIVDANDNAPTFLGESYTASVSESAAVGSLVYDGIRVTDADKDKNAEVGIECYVPDNDANGIFREEARQACEKFSVTSRPDPSEPQVTVGVVTLKQTLDFETKRKYILTVKAEDGGGLSLVKNVIIEVTDVQDSPPQFLNAPLSLVVNEDTPKGASVGEILAQDQDQGIPRRLQISLQASDPDSLFILAATELVAGSNGVYRAEIRTRRAVQRGAAADAGTFVVEAVELLPGGVATSVRADTRVTVTIRDVNDNAPTFSRSEYFVDVVEGLKNRNLVPGFSMDVTDTDAGSNAYFELRIMSATAQSGAVLPAGAYELVPASGTETAAVALMVARGEFLDYEKPEYRRQTLTIVAQETLTSARYSSTATVHLSLVDANDHDPGFPYASLNEYIREDAAVGTVIGNYTATDGDSGSFGQITYTLTGSYASKFSIDRFTGVVTVAEALDYEETPRITLTLTATDGGGRYRSIPYNVIVLDVNDQGPVFESDQYTTFAYECCTQLNPNITVKAVDLESDSAVSYSIAGGNTPDGAFAIDPRLGHFSMRRPVGHGETPDRQGHFILTIEANDGGSNPQKSYATLKIYILDENNNAPYFNPATYTATVTEIAPTGTPVVTVSAKDDDAKENARIVYRIHMGGRDKFGINPDSGLITVNSGADLDIEKYGRTYDLTVHAVDRGSPQLTGTAQVIVTVMDANNQPPAFSQNVYVFSVNEVSAVGSRVATLTASDSDSTARLRYSVDRDGVEVRDKTGNVVTGAIAEKYKSAFAVGPDLGEITVAQALRQDEAGEVRFYMTATDLNAETQDNTGRALVTITIERSGGDGGLAFQPPWSRDDPQFVINVVEEQPKGTVVTQVIAQDPVTGLAIKDYRKVAGSDSGGYFLVNATTGQVSLLRVLDYDTMPSHQLTFQLAAVAPDNQRSAVATVVVNVKDINDHAPVFSQEQYTFNVSEGLTYPAQIGIASANDRDSGNFSRIRYSLSGAGADMFHIDPNTGYIRVAENRTLDREREARYNLLVKATDNPDGQGQKQITSVLLTINLIDINDNVPTFSRPQYSYNVLENTAEDTSVGSVSAVDRDAGANGAVRYSLEDGGASAGGLFYVDAQTGVIYTRTNMTGYARDSAYVLTVRAQDSGSPPAYSSTVVKLWVEDAQSQDGKPRFEFPETDGQVINILEEVEFGTNVTQIVGVDRTPNDDTPLRYGFIGSEHLYSQFSIDPLTGQITVKGRLDHETKQEYELIVYIRDGDKEVTRRLIVNLTDLNDNDPSFGSCPGIVLEDPLVVHVLEEQPAGTFVTTVTACDPDTTDTIFYFITCGNSPVPPSTLAPFQISDNGTITTATPLDREAAAEHLLCVVAGNTPDINVTRITEQARQRRQAEETVAVYGGDMMRVLVLVDDIDDNAPKFGGVTDGQGRSQITAGVSATAQFDEEVVRVFADDPDTGTEISTVYSLKNIRFYGPRGQDSSAPYVFRVLAQTGSVRTNTSSYSFLSYVDGYFHMEVTATDRNGAVTTADLYIYVVRDSQKLKFVFDANVEETRQYYPPFFSELGAFFSGTSLHPDSLHYHSTEDGTLDQTKTDLCFHMVQEKQVVAPDVGLRRFKTRLEDDPELRALFREYTVREVNICAGKFTTRAWVEAGTAVARWSWWWVLVAFALLLFLLCVICIIGVVCCWKRLQKNTLYVAQPKPSYYMIDPSAGAYPPPGSVLPSEVEWQEQRVVMD